MGVRADFKVYEWKDIIPALEAGEVDMIAAGIVVTPQRALRINFTDAVAMSGAGLATNTHMTRDIENLQQLNHPDIVIATVTDTFSEGVARSIFDKAEIHSHVSQEDAEKEILEGPGARLYFDNAGRAVRRHEQQRRYRSAAERSTGRLG